MVNLKAVKNIGLDKPLGKLEKGGIDLSKGQWQRFSSRQSFFLTDTTYTILDEPTASMDPVFRI